MICAYFWIVVVFASILSSTEGQRYTCLTAKYPGGTSHNKNVQYGSRSQGIFNSRYNSSSETEESDDELDDSDEGSESEEGGGQGGEIEVEEDEEIEMEDGVLERGNSRNSTSRPRLYDDRRKKRQAPLIVSAGTTVNKTSSHTVESIGVQLSKSLQNVTTRRDDSRLDDTDTAYEYNEYQEYDQVDSETSSTSTKSNFSQTKIAITSNATFIGIVRCPNPSQKVHLRKVTMGHSSTGYCVRDTTYCSKEISDFKEIMDCEGTFGECRLELSREDIDSCERSNYVKIEYDCIYDHSLFDICSTIHVNRWKEVAIRSPSYPSQAPELSTNVKTCECEIVTDEKSSLSISYLRSDMSGMDDKCDDEVLLFEQKYNAQQTSRFQVTGEVCGEKMAYSRRFGDNQIRLTYLLGTTDHTKQRGGFLTKISAQSYGRGTSLINVKCSSVASNTAGLPPFRQNIKAIPTPIRKTIIKPFIVKERQDILPPLPATTLYHPTTQKPAVSTPRWRVGPRGRKYIPRPGHPNGPLFLDGLGPGLLRRRFNPSRRFRPGLRRKKLFITTAAPLPRTTPTPQPVKNDVMQTSTLPPITTSTLARSAAPSAMTKTPGAVVPVASVGSAASANNVGAVKADQADEVKEEKSAGSGGVNGTLVAVIASMASVIAIIVSIGFYYFYRKRNNRLGRKNALSDTSSVWFSEYYYGVTNFFKNKFTRGGRPADCISSDGSTDESTYESYENDIPSDGHTTIDIGDKPTPENTKSSIFNQTQVVTEKKQTALCDYESVTSPASLEAKLVAPPRKKKKNLLQTVASTQDAKKFETSTDYDNRTTPLPQPPTSTSATTPAAANSTPDDTYDNCISTGTPASNPQPLTPIVEIKDNEDTEYASISEMVDMINTKC